MVSKNPWVTNTSIASALFAEEVKAPISGRKHRIRVVSGSFSAAASDFAVELRSGTGYVGVADNASTSTTLVVAGANWTVNQWAGCWVLCTSGASSGDARQIASNTNDTLTVTNAFTAAPDGDDFEIQSATDLETGTADASSDTTHIVKTSAGWTVNQWAGYYVMAQDSVTPTKGEARVIASNTADTLTLSVALSGAPDDLPFQISTKTLLGRWDVDVVAAVPVSPVLVAGASILTPAGGNVELTITGAPASIAGDLFLNGEVAETA